MIQALPPPAAPPPAVAAPPGQTPTVSAALTDTQVQITRSFSGARIVLYGAVLDPLDRPHDVVVVVRGPEQPVYIVRKKRVGPLWLNEPPLEFRGAPGFYMTASTRELNEVTGFAIRRRLRLGVDNLAFEAPGAERVRTHYGVRDVTVTRPDYIDFRRAVVRLKQRERLYAADSKAVRFVDDGLFRADVALPAAAPTGRYEAEIHLFREGRPVAVRTRTLTVAKVGVERWLYVVSRERPWSYGVLSVAFALLSGWGASRIFQRP
jgi:uncharacterized protein (TIGR02186 family)